MDISDLDKKIVTISALIGADANKPEHFVTRSGYLYEKGAYSVALEDARAAIKLDSSHLPAYLAAASATLKLKKFDEAYYFYKEGLKLDPKSPEIIDGLKQLQELIIADHDKTKTHENSYNAVNLCSQDIYPGDDELFRQESDIVSIKYKIVSAVNQTIKNQNIREANTEAMMAHQCHMTGKSQDALYHCNASLSKDKTNVAARYLRAQLYIDAKDMKGALQDLMLIPKTRRTADIWKMGGKNVW